MTGCIDCPMFDDGSNHEYDEICKHPNAPIQFYEPSGEANQDVKRIKIESLGEYWSKGHKYVPITPDWCPLNKEPITIKKE